MTELDLVAIFKRDFSPEKLIAKSTKWIVEDRPWIEAELEVVKEQLLQRGVLTKEERTELTARRNDLAYEVVHANPARISNDVFDEWLKTNGLYDDTYSPNENRHNNKKRLNRVLDENEENVVVTSNGYKNCMFVEDLMSYAINKAQGLHDGISTGVEVKVEYLRDLFVKVRERYNEDPEFIAEIRSPLRTMAIRQQTDNTEHIQICEVIGDYQSLIQAHQRKLIGLIKKENDDEE